MKFWGIEPKITLFVAPYATLVLSLNLSQNPKFPRLGLFLMGIGIVLWLICYFQVSRAYFEGTLAKEGCYSRIRHPIYSIWGFLIIPGFSLVIGGFMLILPIIYWLAVFIFIKEEEKALEEKFGEEWREYAKKTGRFLPLKLR
ncbi:Protein-S-isoprenylcysteine O-methyltransferase, putative (icmt) [Pyrococcus sp. NA2]|uniref:methyltransferase family protein n=1 Tax=Pyrococcus sp. (strain NA2) TaxID=342949 RepID=UPI000209AAB4|nr:methyltransferase [Pyrococcus sp. NA2]AEC52614.1 Protein-S-isoprenylcysteine O-methyltransferase, putative (icmt) [Pyrococcus sp. NA2]